ncbi:MAG: hypothetical protein V7643_1591 [Mycobacterium sp.]|jgi:hypothetical protein
MHRLPCPQRDGDQLVDVTPLDRAQSDDHACDVTRAEPLPFVRPNGKPHYVGGVRVRTCPRGDRAGTDCRPSGEG